MGAEHLLGKGDMLFLPPGIVAPDARARRVRHRDRDSGRGGFLEGAGQARVRPELPDRAARRRRRPPKSEPSTRIRTRNTKTPSAWCCKWARRRPPRLQRHLRLGYGRAARILDMMQRDGIIGPPDGSKPREVLKRPDWLHEVESAR